MRSSPPYAVNTTTPVSPSAAYDAITSSPLRSGSSEIEDDHVGVFASDEICCRGGVRSSPHDGDALCIGQICNDAVANDRMVVGRRRRES